MPLFSNLIPWQTTSMIETIVYIVAALGAILLTYAVFLKREKRQDVILLIGAGCLIVYALYIDNIIFLIAMSGLAFSSFIEWLEILFGFHKDLGEPISDPTQTQNTK